MSNEHGSGGPPQGDARWLPAEGEKSADPASVGEPVVRRGGSRVEAMLEQGGSPPASEPAPEGRRLSGAEIAAGGLFQARVIEVQETREEAVVGKPVFVREGVVVRNSAEGHVERIEDTVRRTEVEVDELASGQAGDERTADPALGHG